MKKSILLITFVLGLACWSCSKIDSSNGLKQSLEKSTANINTALSKISESKGYLLLTQTADGAKSDEGFNDSISLPLVAGIYDFQPGELKGYNHFYRYRLFKKTGTSDMMIVNLPQKMMYHSKYLYNCVMSDSVLENDFTVTATDYHRYYNWWNGYEYRLTAGFSLNNEDIGSLDVSSSGNSMRKNSYSSRYNFTEGYSIATDWQTGDTTESSMILLKGEDILLKESSVLVWQGFHKSDKQYILTIGNVEIKKTSGIDSIQVFLNGILQKDAAKIITDDTDITGSICYKRDIHLTFDDGTSTKLSELINPARNELRTLMESLHSMNFAKHIVDYIALSIYYDSRE